MTVKISFQGVGKSFRVRRGELTAVDRIDLDIAAGEFVVLVGPSGCGKSTCWICSVDSARRAPAGSCWTANR